MANLRPPVTPEDHIQGPEDAPVTLVEYGDYECPHCGRAYSIIKRVQKHFGKSLRFVFRNFPLNELHPTPNPPRRPQSLLALAVNSGRCTIFCSKTRSG